MSQELDDHHSSIMQAQWGKWSALPWQTEVLSSTSSRLKVVLVAAVSRKRFAMNYTCFRCSHARFHTWLVLPRGKHDINCWGRCWLLEWYEDFFGWSIAMDKSTPHFLKETKVQFMLFFSSVLVMVLFSRSTLPRVRLLLVYIIWHLWTSHEMVWRRNISVHSPTMLLPAHSSWAAAVEIRWCASARLA